jgi:integrase
MSRGVVEGASRAARGTRSDRLARHGSLPRKRWQRAAPAALTTSSRPNHRPPAVQPAPPLRPLIAAYSATFGAAWGPVTRTKHAADFRRFLDWLDETDRPATIGSLDFLTLAAYVADLRCRPKVTGVWRGAPDAKARSCQLGAAMALSLNSVNAYMRPIRSLCLWLVEEGVLSANPFRRSHHRAGLNPLLPSEWTPPKSATLADLQALERGCAGDRPLDLRDQAIVSILKTTAARNSSVRLLRVEDVDLGRGWLVFRRAKGGRTLEVALHPETRERVQAYRERGRPALLGAGADDPGWLFLSDHHDCGPRPLTVNALSLMLRRRYHAGGGAMRTFGSHRLRHATATLLCNHGMPLDELSRYLGHSSTDVTRRYAQQTPDALGVRAAEALARAGLVGR